MTPSQIVFLDAHIERFDPGSWIAESAGRAGSDRHFVRISDQDAAQSYILVIWDSDDRDWGRFLRIGRDCGSATGCLPRIYAADARHGLILEEDLGSATLKRRIDSLPAGIGAEDLYRSVLLALLGWQSAEVEQCETIAERAMNLDMFLWESDYFAEHCVTGYFGKERLLDNQWQGERQALAHEVAALPRTPIHRDFQSENIMIVRERIRFVDFQGARMGPPEYDVASLLFDPYVDVLDREAVYRLFDFYRIQSGRRTSRRAFEIAAAQRLMQALGAFGNLSIHKGKQRYRAFMPIALSRLVNVLSRNGSFPAILAVARECLVESA